MKAKDLKSDIIRRVSEIDDISILRDLSLILDSSVDKGIIQLTEDQLKEIYASKKDIEKGLLIENKLLKKEVKQWLKAR
jgi:hypothetical protein